MNQALRDLPSVDRVLREDALRETLRTTDQARVTSAVRAELDSIRKAILNGDADASDAHTIAERTAAALTSTGQSGLRTVWNCTGTLVHTNLGRAVLPQAAVAAVTAAATRATNLEYDVEAGKRGDRDAHVQDLVCELTGAEAATVVNNNAAAVLLVLNTLALGKEVPVSRGELVEIGDAFRIPDIMSRSGAVLREVGTTNRTHPRDFENAITADTGVLMEVHTSNYIIEGFTARVETNVLADIAHRHDLPLVVDLGSGTLVDLRAHGLPHEPTVQEALAAGADIVTFSGDKLLGGPQAGIIVGTTELITQIKRNPLRRALRVDKLRIAALNETLRLYRHTETLLKSLPTLAAMVRTEADIEAAAARLMPNIRAALPADFTATVATTEAQPGSGALPGRSLPSRALSIAPQPGTSGTFLVRLAQAMRSLTSPIIGRIHEGAIMLDIRALPESQEREFLQTFSELRAAYEANAQ
ncbi:MAG: L-seryl-tRNA(Sec) selenium transferase [Chromatiales bacterium]|nr:L-seryl-tRNA(Sec) selenium transferase [Chromatiales bacterium]